MFVIILLISAYRKCLFVVFLFQFRTAPVSTCKLTLIYSNLLSPNFPVSGSIKKGGRNSVYGLQNKHVELFNKSHSKNHLADPHNHVVSELKLLPKN